MLKIISEDWYADFYGKVDNVLFIEAVNIARKSSKFFPSESDIWDGVAVAKAERNRAKEAQNGQMLIADYTHVDEKGTDMCKEMIAIISRRMVPADDDEFLTEKEAEDLIAETKKKYGM